VLVVSDRKPLKHVFHPFLGVIRAIPSAYVPNSPKTCFYRLALFVKLIFLLFLAYIMRTRFIYINLKSIRHDNCQLNITEKNRVLLSIDVYFLQARTHKNRLRFLLTISTNKNHRYVFHDVNMQIYHLNKLNKKCTVFENWFEKNSPECRLHGDACIGRDYDLWKLQVKNAELFICEIVMWKSYAVFCSR